MHYLRTGERIVEPDLQVQMDTVLEHYEEMMHHYGREAGVKIARKHIGWYTKGLHGSAEFRHMINQVEDPDTVLQELKEFYKPLIDYRAA